MERKLEEVKFKRAKMLPDNAIKSCHLVFFLSL